MKTKLTLFISLLLFGIIAIGQPNDMTPNNRGPHAHFQNHPDFFNHIPNLTDAQKTKIKAIHTHFLRTKNPLKNQLNEKRAHLKTITATDTPNQKEIDNTIDEIGRLHTQILKARVAMQLKIRALLTDEQKVYFDAHNHRNFHQQKGPNFCHHGMRHAPNR